MGRSFLNPKATRQADVDAFLEDVSELMAGSYGFSDALIILRNEGKYRSLLDKVETSLSDGALLSETLLQTCPKIDPFVVLYIEAGEKSGNLRSALAEVSSKIAAKRNLQRSLSEVLFYPRMVLSVGLIIFNLFWLFFVPFMNDFLNEMGLSSANVPYIPGMGLRSKLFLLPLDIVVLVVILDRRISWHLVPFNVRKLSEHAWFFSSLDAMLNAGMPIASALKSLSDISLQEKTKQHVRLKDIYDTLEGGERLSMALSRDSRYWGAGTISKVAIAERNDSLASSFHVIAEQTDQRRANAISMYTQMIRSMSILIAGIFVYLLAYSIYKPMLNMLLDLSGI
ncbi:type II secretion system F family protein [Coprothermobacter platensis]|uniref:type II secretion system F family protein n=1 Tax=Coprothermobacter platensis TaxID=108819 RepID=UPI00037A5E17|nr:type II secretion system F family protein [Coprothermobacter platensis]